jgi:hypothetical protein
MVLDVDGTISRIYSDEEYDAHRDEPDWYQPLPLDEAVIDALDEQARRPGVEVAWLTSWGPSQESIDSLVHGLHLRGRLAGSAVPWINFPRRGWRSRSLLTYVEQIRPHAVIWADDLAPGSIRRRIDERIGTPRLVIRPHVHVGLTMDHVDRIRAFINQHT